ncbi:MFS transporter [Streptomyces sp. NPDC002285]
MSRDYWLYLGGQTGSAFGSIFTGIAVPLIAVQYLNASAMSASLLTAAYSLPLLLFSIPAGSMADRLRRRRRVLLMCDLLSAAVISLLLLIFFTSGLTILVLGVAVFLLSSISTVTETVYMLHLQDLVPSGNLARARARLELGEHVGRTSGRALASTATALGMAIPFIIDLISFLLSALTLRLIGKPDPDREPSAARQPTIDNLSAGFRKLTRQQFLRRLMRFLFVQQLTGGITTALIAPFLLRQLHVPTNWYGLLFILVGAAGATGAWLSSILSERIPPSSLAIAGFVGMAISAAMLPLAGGPFIVATVLASLGIGLPSLFSAVANVGLTTYVVAQVPEEILGRVSGSMHVVSAGAAVIGAVLGGVLGTTIGITPTLWLASILSIASLAILFTFTQYSALVSKVKSS